ncbi:nucleoside transporter [Trichoderma arundinaceum]|uniref:Nucleoside transporter n=1 Tax=Trichoderma arundinaceum TaxID=490622 RepID=A0A395NSW0_TRIAR|nr:nucleoside transporter [Trichoderma arundinaceum]
MAARPEYQSLADVEDHATASDEDSALLGVEGEDGERVPFSWIEYGIFCFLGMAMLWAWNMFLAAAPYFASRFAGDSWIEANFQSTILTVSTLTNLVSALILSHIQHSASYPFRINLALIINTVIFGLLTGSTAVFLNASPRQYLSFVLTMVACTSWAAGLMQNGAFAFAAGFGRSEYMQALMVGQGVAGVLPSIAQVVSVLLFPPGKENAAGEEAGSSSAFYYFLAAVVISLVTLVAIIPLVRRHNRLVADRLTERLASSMTSIEEAERATRKVVSLLHLLKKLRWLAFGVALVFAVTMFFPVFTVKILSVHKDGGLIFQPAVFIPVGFLFWNIGDLAGRIATMLPFSLAHRPLLLFVLAVARIALLPLYLLCNLNGRGAIIPSDFFYLFIVQIVFGVTNGWLGSSFMIASGEWVEENEREATGGFMGLCLVAGLASGSLLSFTISGI